MQALSDRASLSVPCLLLPLFLITASLLTGCGSFSFGDTSTAASITAASSTIRVNQQLQITPAALRGGDHLIYFVNGVEGGNSTVGAINSAGLYTAPALVPSPDSVTITAASAMFSTAPKGSVSLQVWNPIPVLGGVTPSAFTEGMTTVQVNGSQFVYGAQIRWNGALLDTTYVSGTQLVAEIAAPNPGTFPLTVTNPNPGSASANPVNVKVGPGKVGLLLDTGGGVDVRVLSTLTFGLTVNGTNNTGITLAVNGIAGGNAEVGTAVSRNGLIAYTAPAVVPTPSNIVQLTITSIDDPTIALAQNIAVMNPIPILTAATPASFNPGPATIVLTGRKFITGAQVLANGAPVTTAFNSGTQLTATVDLTEPGNLDLQVLNPAPGPSTSADLIATVNGTPPTPIVNPPDAARFLEQATFGPTDAGIRHLSMIGYEAWLNEQFNIAETPEEPAVEQAVMVANPPCAPADVKCNAGRFEQNSNNDNLVQGQFWQAALSGNDELRERVKYSLSQLFVISSNNSTPIQSMPRGEANYYDMLGKDAFGNFRKLLQDVTLSPMMGQFLNMLGNDKGNATTDPDENYAREIMQLFTIGLWQLNEDGTQKLDAKGNPIPTYSNLDVKGLAAVFTGFSWTIPGNDAERAWSDCCAYVGPGHGEELLPMQSFAGHHAIKRKQFLGVTIPASGSSDPDGDLKLALDTIFHHPNLPPFFARQMIQHLVTSNPSPAYISRVANVFKNDGTGVRGNLQAVISAILLDPEARDTASATANPQYGKVREPLLRYTEWARAFTAQSRNASYNTGSTEDPIYGLGEMWLRSPTVFNWFSPGYTPPGTPIATGNLLAPEMQITNVSTVVGFINYMQDAIGASQLQGPDVFSSYAEEIRLAANPDQLMDRINLLLMSGQMSNSLYNAIEGAVTSIPIPSGNQTEINAALRSRVQTAIYLTVASPDFAAQQ
ncbi:MAG TPA: DUF1800 domain-containing protein [Terracidiphilus sp.]|jgi:uncharacterized protein (DUF1800 family)